MWKKFALSLLSIIVTLLIIEVYLALFSPVEYLRPPKEIPESAWRILMHRPSNIPGLAFELTPNRSTTAVGVLVETNSFGMRDDEPRSAENQPTYRILALGDSFTFGYGVEENQAYPQVLEKLLNQAQAVDGSFEVLNLAVGGYSTQDEVLVLEHKGLQWEPDILLIGYVLNDPEIDPIQPTHRFFQKPHWWQHSHAIRLALETKNAWDIERLGDGDYYKYLHAPETKQWQSVLTGFEAISSMAAEQNIPVLVVIFPHLFGHKPWTDYPYKEQHAQVANAAETHGFFALDLLDAYEQYSSSILTLSNNDPHPSIIGHQLSAQAIYAWLLDHPEILSK